MKKRKYAAVGTGARIPMFIDPIVDRFRDNSELVGLCDLSETRRTYHQQRLVRDYGSAEIPLYGNFDQMLAEQKPDVVIICTPDHTHHEYIIKSLNAGMDVISEKPLTTDAKKCQDILDTVKRTGRKVRTAFNYRWAPGASKVRELVAKGEIGQVKHVDFEYLLNTKHGADYFRRWHSQKELSGGLLVHKATHHFDLLNWWIDSIPATVFAFGDLVFYGKANAIARGDEALARYDRYTGSAEALNDPFRLMLDEDPSMRELYYEAEKESGYIRDQNVFRENITIEDTMSLLIKYRTGTTATYSLNAFCPYEGFRVAITGDAGRIEYSETHASHIITGEREERYIDNEETAAHLRMQKLFSDPVDVEIPIAEGGHGGGDPLIQEQIFSSAPPHDSLGRNAGHEQGAASLVVGAAGNLSISTGQPVKIDEILRLKPEAKRLSELD